MDIAVPRDIDPAAGQVSNVFLYNIDDLDSISETHRQAREQEAQWAEEIVTRETEAFLEWSRTQEALPTVIALRHKAEIIRQKELRKALKKLGHQPALEELESLEAMTRAIVKKLLHSPTVYLKAQSNTGRTRLVREIFDLEDDAEKCP
jgi:glutamyl-tRNA reductase